MLDENWFIPGDDAEDFAEEVSLEFDGSQDPEAVWEWNGETWMPVAAWPPLARRARPIGHSPYQLARSLKRCPSCPIQPKQEAARTAIR